ncbi:hypothetical protein FKN01_32075 [Streptomyces sp. 130]|uniref:hypothetical protein n=1 Tax=Streptomyces sp. 130 TaxID=2591006 RepID=UPI001180E61D|nr:hypothetical protein [Streptomyces sp. 130]TRV71178.1 hypothetical protein FKN01_32075 [Streptomyces sp. 130]
MMSRRRRNTPDPQPEPTQPPATPAPDAAILERLATLEKTISGQDTGPIAVHNRQVLEEQARDTRPAGPGPVPHCSYCGLQDSSTGWRRTPSARGGWACTGCSLVANPPFVNGRRTVPHSHDVPGLLASAYFDIEPIPWLLKFGQRFGLDWPYATEPSTTAWAHVGDLAQWRKVAALAVDRKRVGMNYLPPFDWEAWHNRPEPDMRRVLVGGGHGEIPRTQLVEVQPEAPDPAEVERQALAQLAAEEKDVARRLKALRRQEKEAAAAASEAAAKAVRIEEIRTHYHVHRDRLEGQYKVGLEELRQALHVALEREGLA